MPESWVASIIKTCKFNNVWKEMPKPWHDNNNNKNLHVTLSYGYLRYALHQRTHKIMRIDIVINEFEVIIMIIGIRNEHTLIILTLFYYERFLLLVIFDAFLCGFHIKSSIFANFLLVALLLLTSRAPNSFVWYHLQSKSWCFRANSITFSIYLLYRSTFTHACSRWRTYLKNKGARYLFVVRSHQKKSKTIIQQVKIRCTTAKPCLRKRVETR